MTYKNNGEEELKKYKKGDNIEVKVLEIKVSEQKIRVGLKQTQADPFDWFKDKKINQIITVKIISSDNKGLVVRPEGCEMDFQIKKSNIAINAADARPSRFTGDERIDCAIADIDLTKRKVILSIKLLEEIEKKEALEKYGSEGSGKNLPFSSLSDDLKKKVKRNKRANLAIVKSKLLKQLSKNYPNFLKKDLEKFIDIILKEIKLSLKRGERVELRGFGVFSTNIQKPRISRNPKTGQKVNTPKKE